MNRRQWLTYLVGLTPQLWALTRGIRRPKARVLAMIAAYRQVRAAAGCALCAAQSGTSYSAGIAATIERPFGLPRATFAFTWSFLILSVGPRDTFGWRRGGI